MDEKRPMPIPAIRGPAGRRTRPCIATALVGLFIFVLHLWPLPALPGSRKQQTLTPTPPLSPSSPVQPQSRLIPLEAHIMSKCPDAKDCLRDMILPAMQRVHDKVDFTLSFIGELADNDGVNCKHGSAECLGNIIELCAQALYPDPKTSLGFTMCLTREYKKIPQRNLIEDCALEHAIDFSKLNECATKDDGAYGMSLLRNSVQRTKQAGVIKSCTVRLDEKIYCVRDEKEWKDCPSGPAPDDLVTAIERLSAQS